MARQYHHHNPSKSTRRRTCFCLYPTLSVSNPISQNSKWTANKQQVTLASFSPSHHSTTCRFTRAPVPSYTAYLVSSTRWMASPRDDTSNRPNLVPSWTWSPIDAQLPVSSSSSPALFHDGASSSKALSHSTWPVTTFTCFQL